MKTLLNEYGIEAERFAAIEHSYGLYGCGLSHLAVLKMARDNGWKNVLILEDDIYIQRTPEDFHKDLSQYFEKGPEFDVCMLDINPQRVEPVENYDWLIRVLYAHCAGAYIVQGHYYQKLIDLYEWALPILEQTQIHWEYANDVIWEKLQAVDRWYTFQNQMCKQMGGYSDTKNIEL
jgi:GR25 family glycosyltransferase involved in LPS biosynthesis